MKELVDKLTALGYVVSNVESKILGSGFSFDVNGTTVRVTDKKLKDVDGVVECVVNNIDKEEKMKTVTETLRALVQDLDNINNVVFNEHSGMILVAGNMLVNINDFEPDGITARIFINNVPKGRVTARKYEDLLEEIKSYLNGNNELNEIGSELVNYLKLDDYKIDDSMIKITLPNNREMKIGHKQENVYSIGYKTKQKTCGNNETVDMMDTWYYEQIKTDSVKNLAKIIVLKYIYNF